MALTVLLVVGCRARRATSRAARTAAGARGRSPTKVAPWPTPAADRQVITTANASVVVDDPADTAQRLSELVEAAGGRVDERTEYAETGDDGDEGASPTSWCASRRTR